MRAKITRTIADTKSFRSRLLAWIDQFDVFAVLDSADFYTTHSKTNLPDYHSYDLVAAVGHTIIDENTQSPFATLKKVAGRKDWLFGFLSYDLKNDIYPLNSSHNDPLGFPQMHFFVPEVLFRLRDGVLTLEGSDDKALEQILGEVYRHDLPPTHPDEFDGRNMKARMSRKSYLDKVNAIREHIYEGDVYELNFCQEFYHENINLSPSRLFYDLVEQSPAPFAAFYRIGPRYIISASMERFLKKTGRKLISQPIKGTIRRGVTAKEDEQLRNTLFLDEKERAENIMIVDLVRNDLARSSVPGSVSVEELFGIYAFPAVHQMISTVSSTIRDDVHFIDALKDAFPMGSMTGAPKQKAMELIERYEVSRRGIYSGAIGYITPAGDFDFNVVIRSFLYHEAVKYLSIHAGSAITYDSVPTREFEECDVKIRKLLDVLEATAAPTRL